MENISKIVIIGGPGSGKSTLANNLGKKLKIPVYHIDAIHHLKNWKMRDKQERDSIILKIINKPKWIMDGTYRTTLEERIQKAQLIIFLNYSVIARLKGIFSRYFKNRGGETPNIPGCKEKMTLEFIKCTITWYKTKGSTINSLLEKYKDKKIMIFKNRKSLNKWYKLQFGENMELI